MGKENKPALVAQLDVCLTGDREVAGLTRKKYSCQILARSWHSTCKRLIGLSLPCKRVVW